MNILLAFCPLCGERFEKKFIEEQGHECLEEMKITENEEINFQHQ